MRALFYCNCWVEFIRIITEVLLSSTNSRYNQAGFQLEIRSKINWLKHLLLTDHQSKLIMKTVCLWIQCLGKALWQSWVWNATIRVTKSHLNTQNSIKETFSLNRRIIHGFWALAFRDESEQARVAKLLLEIVGASTPTKTHFFITNRVLGVPVSVLNRCNLVRIIRHKPMYSSFMDYGNNLELRCPTVVYKRYWKVTLTNQNLLGTELG